MTYDTKFDHQSQSYPNWSVQFLISFDLLFRIVSYHFLVIGSEMMLVLREKRPHGIPNLLIHLVFISVKVSLVFEWVKYESAEKAFVLLNICR